MTHVWSVDSNVYGRNAWYRSSVRHKGSEFWCMSWDAVGIRGNFPIRIGSGMSFGVTIIGFGVECLPGPCLVI